jgi:predicted RNA-binding protein with PUA-like domain
MSTQYWLMKTEPGEYSLEDLKAEKNQTEHWDGVRNYQARNFMRDQMQVGDGVLFYHSGKKPQVVGTARVVRTGYPDHTAWDPKSNHYDPKSMPENPIWFMVDIQFESEFERPLPLRELRRVAALNDMLLLRRGNRLSVMPVTKKEFQTIVRLGQKKS